ncbi:pimeloyl-ACP methyl ester carboxylesterase [Ornithinimicrobium humiphilum]|uniref:Pimeloyl-ACP methyl ester carboxylesterase n=1 Tax=Ornithinimicrobium humiphilum TaxID=125288 RepID=A0A543KP35_9MICO|nr:pimeloyl-ACP methyl ester carboxylesterase [Ornithinimicrobium humiphilum]
MTPMLHRVQPCKVHRYGNPDSRAVVLVHGLTDAGTAWPDLVQHWGDRWDVHAVDLRGHGESPRFTDAELADAPAVMLADLVAVIDDLPEPAALVGHSLGGLLSLRATLARPDRVWALVLEDPARPTGAQPDPDFLAHNEEFLESVDADPEKEIRRMAVETIWSRSEIEAWAACKPLVDRDYIRRGLHLGDPVWEGLFNALMVPTLLVLPPDAPMAPRAEAVHNPLVRTAVVADAGHCVRRDQPGEYHRLVDDFLAEAAPR